MTSTKTTRVLWVDDNPDILEVYELILMQDANFETVGLLLTQDELEAEIANRSPQIVVLDLSMSGRDPLEVMKECLDKFPDVRFLINTGYDDPQTIESVMAAGATGYKVKDGDLPGLLRCLRQVAAGEKVVPGEKAMPAPLRFA